MRTVLASRPAASCLLATAVVLGLAWRGFLLGGHSPFASDVEHYHHPVTVELARAWEEGRVPLWTDGVYLGFPFFADPQTAAWYPGTLLPVAFGPHVGTIGFLLLHALLAALGTAGWVRSHGCSFAAAWLAGLVVALSGYFAHEIQHPGLFAILAWIPAWLWATHRLVERPSGRRVAVAALPVAMMIFAGTLQALFGAAIAYGLYVGGLALEARRGRGTRAALGALGLATATPLLGLALAGVVLLPAFQHFPHTARELGMTYRFGSMGSVHPLELASLFLAPAGAALGGGGDFRGASFYTGALTLPLALVAALGVRRILPVSLAAAVGLLAVVAMGRYGGLHPLLYGWLPETIGILRGMGRALGPATVCLALLAALGLQRLGDGDPAVRRLLGGLLLLTAAAQTLILLLAPGPLSPASCGGLGVLAAGLVCLWLAGRHPRRLQAGLVTLAVVDLLAFGALGDAIEQTPAPPGPNEIAGSLPVLHDLAGGAFGAPAGRTLVQGFGPRNVTLLAGLAGVGGYNPLVTLRYLDFVSLTDRERLFPREPIARFVHTALPVRLDSPLLDAAGVRFVVSTAPLEIDGMRLLDVRPRQPRRTFPAHLYENADAVPPAYLAYRTRVVGDLRELEAALGPGFDPHDTTVVESPAEPLEGPAEIQPVAATRERPERLRFEIAPTRPALLVVPSAWYPGWHARVDGAAAPVLRVNGFFRGVAVPAGAREIEMRFEPWILPAGAGVSAAAAVLTATLALLGRGRDRA